MIINTSAVDEETHIPAPAYRTASKSQLAHPALQPQFAAGRALSQAAGQAVVQAAVQAAVQAGVQAAGALVVQW